LKRKSHRRVYEILKKWGVQEYEVIDKKALQEITLGASILATGGGADPDDLEDEIERIFVAERMGCLTRTFDKDKGIVNN
jgi:shikimate kinase